MKYKNVQDILPDKLVQELQIYVSGETIYVPKANLKINGESNPEPEVTTNGATKKFVKKIQTENR